MRLKNKPGTWDFYIKYRDGKQKFIARKHNVTDPGKTKIYRDLERKMGEYPNIIGFSATLISSNH